jgi:hypothetical protein
MLITGLYWPCTLYGCLGRQEKVLQSLQSISLDHGQILKCLNAQVAPFNRLL